MAGGFEDGGFLREYHDALRKAGAAKAALDNLERRRKRAIAQAITSAAGPYNKAEHAALLDPAVVELDELIAMTAQEHQEAAADVTWLAARLDVWRTRQSTYREQLKREPTHDRTDTQRDS